MGTLRTEDEIILGTAHPYGIESTFGGMHNNFIHQQFLSGTNYLSINTVKTVEKEFKKKNKRKRKKHLKGYLFEYVAASTLVHHMDGWSYFQNSMNTILKGDIAAAQHLLYYSELRSVMSLFATRGIAVFSGKHYSLTNKGNVLTINDAYTLTNSQNQTQNKSIDNVIGTHDFAWQAFEAYFKNSSNRLSILDIYTLNGISFTDWLTQFGVNASMKESLIEDFLNKLSFDLAHFSSDRTARNESSYRPTRIVSDALKPDYLTNLQDMARIWELAEPASVSGEIALDSVLLGEMLQMAFKQTNPTSSSAFQAPRQFDTRLELMMANLGIDTLRQRVLKVQFKRNNKDIFDILKLNSPQTPNYIRGILYRSFFLLRLSGVYCKNLLSQNNHITKEDLSFWWDPIGVDFGLWHVPGEIEEFSDLYQDYYDIAESFKNLFVIHQETGINVKQFWANEISVARVLSTSVRIGLWNLGL